jgi:hypothetical protein
MEVQAGTPTPSFFQVLIETHNVQGKLKSFKAYGGSSQMNKSEICVPDPDEHIVWELWKLTPGQSHINAIKFFVFVLTTTTLPGSTSSRCGVKALSPSSSE